MNSTSPPKVCVICLHRKNSLKCYFCLLEMAKRCSVEGCPTKKYYGIPSKSSFRFPKDPVRCQKWVDNIDCPKLTEFMSKSPIYMNISHRICSDHFEDSQFTNIISKSRLSWDAIPTLFNHGKEVKHKIRVRRSQMLNNEMATSVIQVADTEVVDVDHSYCKEEVNLECINQSDDEGLDNNSIDGDNSSASQMVDLEEDPPSEDLDPSAQKFSFKWKVTDSKKPSKSKVPVIVFAENTEKFDDVEMVVSSSNYGYPKKNKLQKKSEKIPPTPKAIELKKLVRKQRVKICRLEKKVRSLEQKLTEKFKNSMADERSGIRISSTSDLFKMKKSKAKYSEFDKEFALTLFDTCSRAYKVCSQTFPLPNERTIHMWRSEKHRQLNQDSCDAPVTSNLSNQDEAPLINDMSHQDTTDDMAHQGTTDDMSHHDALVADDLSYQDTILLNVQEGDYISIY